MKPAPKFAPRTISKIFIIYFILNAVGLFIYFIACTSISDLAHAEQRDYYDGVDGVTYFCTAVPVLVLFLLVNVLWGVKILKDIFLRKGCYALVAGIIVAILWASNLGFCNFLARAAVQNGINHFP